MVGGVQATGPLGDRLRQLVQGHPTDDWIPGVPQELEGLGCPSDMGLVLCTGDTQAPKGLRQVQVLGTGSVKEFKPLLDDAPQSGVQLLAPG